MGIKKFAEYVKENYNYFDSSKSYLYEGQPLTISDELAKWTIRHFNYLNGKETPLNLNDIDPKLLIESKKLFMTYADKYIYRGIKVNQKQASYTFKNDSWTFDEQTAIDQFIGRNGGLLFRYPIDEVNNLLSIDLVIDNITKDQYNRIIKEDPSYKKLFDRYVSESECIVFDEIKLSASDATIIKENPLPPGTIIHTL